MKNIPKGEWKSSGMFSGWSSQDIGDIKTIQITNKVEWWAYVRGETLEQAQEISKLFCDAGNTYTQTQLTPSEILAQRNELLECLKQEKEILKMWIRETMDGGWSTHQLNPQKERVEKLQSIISKIEQ